MTGISIDWAAYMAPAARRLRGEPSHESHDELRFGGRGSLCITLTGRKRGTWYDHEAGEGGGVLAFVKREMGYGGDREAVDWLRSELGAAIPERARGRRSTADYARELAARMKPLAGTPAEAYLTTTRGLAEPFPADIRFHPRVRAKAGGELPALLCLARDADGEVRFVHAVFLDGDRKAGFSPAEEADRWALDRLVPPEAWNGDIEWREAPDDVVEAAERLRISPAIVAGRVRWATRDYRRLSRLVGHGEARRHFPEAGWAPTDVNGTREQAR